MLFILFFLKYNKFDSILKVQKVNRKRPWSDIDKISDGDKDIIVKSRKCSFPNKITCDIRDPTSCIDCSEGNFSCTHFDKDINIYEGETKTSNFYPANKSKFEGYCINVVGNPTKQCNPKTGRLILSRTNLVRDGYFFTCQCKYPNIYTKKYRNSDCDMPVRCSIKNLSSIQDILTHGVCNCPENYKSVNLGFDGPRCIKKILRDNPYMPEQEGFVTKDSKYYQNNWEVGLRHKHPCQWDMRNQNIKLMGNRLFKKWDNAFCLCDPWKGNFPVYPEDSVLSSKSNIFPAGCSSIYSNGENTSHTFSEIIQYYETVEPKVLWNFTLKNGKKIVVKVKWPYSMVNLWGRHNKLQQPVSVRCEGIPVVGFTLVLREYACRKFEDYRYYVEGCDALAVKDFTPVHWYFNRVINREYMIEFLRTYNQILCKVPIKQDKDKSAYTFYNDTVVLNPFLMNPIRNKDNYISAGGLVKKTSIEDELSNVIEFTLKDKILYFKPYTKKTLKNARSKCKGVPMQQCSS